MDMKRLKNNMWTLLTESPPKPPQVRRHRAFGAWSPSCCTVAKLRLLSGADRCGAGGGVWGEDVQRDHKDVAKQVPADLLMVLWTESVPERCQVSAIKQQKSTFSLWWRQKRDRWSRWCFCLCCSRLPNSMAQNLSVPLAFVALLHLANEKVSESITSAVILFHTFEDGWVCLNFVTTESGAGEGRRHVGHHHQTRPVRRNQQNLLPSMSLMLISVFYHVFIWAIFVNVASGIVWGKVCFVFSGDEKLTFILYF